MLLLFIDDHLMKIFVVGYWAEELNFEETSLKVQK